MTIGYVGKLGNYQYPGAAITNTYAPTGGNLCVVHMNSYATGALTTPVLTDTRGNTIPPPIVDTGITSPDNNRQTIWVIPITNGGAGHFGSTAPYASNLDVWELSGCDSGGALDGSPVTLTNGGPTWDGSYNTSDAGSVVFSSFWQADNQSAPTHTMGGPEELTTENNDGETSDQMILITTSPGTVDDNIGGSWAATYGSIFTMFAIKAAGAAPSYGVTTGYAFEGDCDSTNFAWLNNFPPGISGATGALGAQGEQGEPGEDGMPIPGPAGAAGAAGGGLTYTAEATSFSAVANNGYWITGNAVAVTLPTTPADGSVVAIANGGTITLSGTTVVPGGSDTIMGLGTMTCNRLNFSFALIYRSATTDWRIV